MVKKIVPSLSSTACKRSSESCHRHSCMSVVFSGSSVFLSFVFSGLSACLLSSLVCLSLSVCLSFCVFVHVSVCLSVCLCVCLSACLSVCLSVFLSVCLSVIFSGLSACLLSSLVCLSVCVSVFPCVYLSVVFFGLSVSVCLSVDLSVCLSVQYIYLKHESSNIQYVTSQIIQNHLETTDINY